jgi:hypothetical protein
VLDPPKRVSELGGGLAAFVGQGETVAGGGRCAAPAREGVGYRVGGSGESSGVSSAVS